jgi:hypothetical protein
MFSKVMLWCFQYLLKPWFQISTNLFFVQFYHLIPSVLIFKDDIITISSNFPNSCVIWIFCVIWCTFVSDVIFSRITLMILFPSKNSQSGVQANTIFSCWLSTVKIHFKRPNDMNALIEDWNNKSDFLSSLFSFENLLCSLSKLTFIIHLH